MSNPGDALLSHLRADVELKAEVIKALRAERERESEAFRQQMLLLGGVSADLLDLSTSVGLLFEEGSSGAVQRAADQLKGVCADLADYTAAVNGQLVIRRKPLNIGRLLSRIASRHVIDVRVAAPVPERIIADEAQLSRLLSYFVDQFSESGQSEARLLEVTMLDHPAATVEVQTDDPDPNGSTGSARAIGLAGSLPRMQFVLHIAEAQAARAKESDGDEQPPRIGSFDALRAALVHSLCGLMDAVHSGTVLTMPVQSAADQAHTGIFRLAASEMGATAPANSRPSRAAAAPSTLAVAAPPGRQTDEAIDLLYLDRQLGSLALVILARTGPAFISDAQRRMTDLLVAHECADLMRLECLARTWKGSALSVGARGLASLLDSVEKQAGMGHLPSPGAIWQIRGTLDKVVRALDRQNSGGLVT